MELREISSKLNDVMLATCRHLLPAGVVQGGEYCVGGIEGDKGQSLRIHMSGQKAGVWCDFATGESGADLIDLWMAVRRISLVEAMDEARAWLGVERPKFIAPKKEYKPPVKPNVRRPDGAVEAYLKARGLSDEVIKLYRIGAEGDRMIFPFLSPDGELEMCKFRSIHDKKLQGPTSAGQKPVLFGWHTISPNAREVWITEGELDAPSCRMLGGEALSVPFGGGAGAKQQWIENDFDRMERFDTIYLALDMDDEGEAAAREIAERLGHYRCLRVSMPKKDMNDCLNAGVTLEQIKKTARGYDPEELRSAHEYHDEIMRELFASDVDIRGFQPRHDKLQGKFRLRDAELIIANGINGHGKSQLVGQWSLDAAEQGEKVCIASMEMPAHRLLARMTRQACGVDSPTEAYASAAINWYAGKLWLFDLVGTAKVDRMLEVFTYARKRYGITVFVIDNMSKCGIGDDDYTGQKRFMEMLCDFKNTTGATVILVTHSRKGESEDAPTGKMDVKGSGSITDLADSVVTIWRNKRKEKDVAEFTDNGLPVPDDLIAKPDSVLYISKQRNGDWEGSVGMYWRPAMMQFVDNPTTRPHQYVKWSIQDQQDDVDLENEAF